MLKQQDLNQEILKEEYHKNKSTKALCFFCYKESVYNYFYLVTNEVN